MFASLTNLYTEALMPNMTVYGLEEITKVM